MGKKTYYAIHSTINIFEQIFNVLFYSSLGVKINLKIFLNCLDRTKKILHLSLFCALKKKIKSLERSVFR